MESWNLNGSPRRLPVSVLTGFLGSGKTTVLNYLIQQPALSRTLVLINEFGEIGLDHDLVTHSKDEVVIEMASGCLCCTIRGDLAKTLREAPGRFARGGELWFDRVVIETTGLADPAPILHTLMTDPGVARRYRLDGVIATVDAVNGGDTLDRQIESVKQAAVADRLLLTKADLADLDELRRLQERLRILNPAAPQIIVENGAVDPILLFDAGLYDPKTKSPDVQNWLKAEAYGEPHGHGHGTAGHGHTHQHNDVNRHDAHIKALCLTIDEPIRGDALDRWLEVLLQFRGADFLRTKGIINVAELDGPVVIHGVQHIFHPPVILKEWPSKDRRSRIVFITRDIDESILRDTLRMFTDATAQRPEPLPAESGDSDIAMFEVRP
ncbi:MAG: GTP-binding protein [Gammaproteobacteria bacterium]|nr:GTP-binding protein [Gammaproteobacteria bacterium]